MGVDVTIAEPEPDDIRDELVPGKLEAGSEGSGELLGMVVAMGRRVGVMIVDGLNVDDIGDVSGVIGMLKRSCNENWLGDISEKIKSEPPLLSGSLSRGKSYLH